MDLLCKLEKLPCKLWLRTGSIAAFKHSPQIWFTNNCACFIHGYFMVTSATHMGLKAIKTLAEKHRKKKNTTADTLTTSLIFYSEALLSVDGGVR